MKRILKMAAVAFVIVLGSSWQNKAAAQPSADDEVTYQTFYDELSPHGRWVDDQEYGYVWIPDAADAGQDFRPYSTNGHWVYTDDYEWMWVSDYDWGWAPFHYGRWEENPSYGWFWVPGYEWSPAWVAWRDGGDYYGWAPLRPGINISINFSIGSYSPPYDYWNFAPRRYITSPRIYDYCYDRHQNVTIINQTTIINNYNYNRNVFRTGPRRNEVEIYTGRINPVRFRESSRPGRTIFRNNEVNVYRPGVRRDNERQFAPRSFERSDRRMGNNDGRISSNDNRDRRTNNGNDNNRFDRNGANRRDNNISNRGNDNNAPQRGQSNSPFERRGVDTRQPSDNNNRNANDPRGRQSPDRSAGAGNNRQPDDGRMYRGQQQPATNPGTNTNDPRGRQFPDRSAGAGGSRQPDDGRMYRRQEQPATNPGNNTNGNRQFERRGMDRNTQPEVREPRREVRTDNSSRPSPQANEARQQQQQQPRQFERRNNNSSRQQGGNESSNSRGQGRGRN